MIRSALVFLAVSSGAAAAQSIPVRTAEHDGFTRIAIDFREGAEWRVEQEGRSVRILTEGDSAYDLSDVYRRIGAERVKTFRQISPRELVVDLACACAPETFKYGDSLVLDVSLQTPDPEVDAQPMEPALTFGPGVPLYRETLLPGLLTRRTPADVANPAPASVRAERAAALRARLRTDLGLDSGDQGPERAAPAVGPEREMEIEAPIPGQMQVESQIERDTRGYEKVSPRATCPEFADGTLETWANARRSLAPEAGDEAWSEAEAKRLIAFGFGIEAEQLLSITGNKDRESRLLTRLAQVVDAPKPAPEIAAIAECSDMLTLFALISDPPQMPLRVSSVLDAIATSPEESRSYLKRRAIAGLMALGQEEDARIVAGAGDSAAAAGTLPDLTSLSLEAGEGPVSADALEEIVTRRTPEAAAAIRMMIDGMVDDGTPISPYLLDQARALLRETTGSNRDRLLRAIIRAETAAGRYVRAAEEIDGLAGSDAAMASRLLNDLFGTIHSIEDDALFLTQVVSLGDRAVPSADLRVAIAARIAENHVPKLALRLLSQSTEAPSTEERLLRASLSLKMGNADEAEAHLAGLTGPEADAIRNEIATTRTTFAPALQPVMAPTTVSGVRSRGSALVEQSAALRSELEQFLGN